MYVDCVEYNPDLLLWIFNPTMMAGHQDNEEKHYSERTLMDVPMERTPVKNTWKLSTLFVFACFFLGLINSISNQEWFTSYSLIETILFITPLIFVSSKYWSSAIISRYQDQEYAPPKRKQTMDIALVNVSVYLIQPVCWDLLYACFFLFFVKFLPLNITNHIASGVYAVYEFNTKHLQHPLSILLSVMGVLTLLKFLSHTHFKKLKKIEKSISLPFKVAAIIVLFINVDSGVSGKYISWKINKEAPKPAPQLTFNAAKDQEEKVRNIISDYVDDMVQQLAVHEQLEYRNDTTSESVLYAAINNIKELYGKEPAIQKDLYEGFAQENNGGPPPQKSAIPEDVSNDIPQEREEFSTVPLENDGPHDMQEQNIYHDIEPKRKVYSAEEKNIITAVYDSPQAAFEPTTAYTAAYSKDDSWLDNFRTVLQDDRKSIRTVATNENVDILKDLLKEYIGETYFFKEAAAHVHSYSFIKSKALGFMKEKLAAGLFDLFNKTGAARVTVQDIRQTSRYILYQCRRHFRTVADHIRTAKKLMIEHSHRYTDALALKKKELADAMESGHIHREKIRAYMEDFPNDPDMVIYRNITQMDEVLEKIKKRTYDGTTDHINVEFWENYISSHPHSGLKNFSTVVKELELLQDLSSAKVENTSKSWQGFLDKHPHCAFKQAIEKRIRIYKENEAFDYAQAVNTEEEWTEFLHHYPHNPNREIIRSALQNDELQSLGRQEAMSIAEGSIITEASGRSSEIMSTIALPLEHEEESIMMRVLEAFSHVH